MHVGINPVGAVVQIPGSAAPVNWNQTLETHLMGLNGDWYRFASQNYMVWTDRTLAEIVNGIIALPGFHTMYVLATEVSSLDGQQTNGWMPMVSWDSSGNRACSGGSSHSST